MKKILLVLLALMLSAAAALGAQWTHLERLHASELHWTGEGASAALDFPGSIVLEGTGNRALPGRFVRVALPLGERLADFNYHMSAGMEVSTSHLPARISAGRREDGLSENDPGIAQGELILMGQASRRGQREALFYWRPLQLQGDRLLLHGELELTLISEIDPNPPLQILRNDRGEASSVFRVGSRPSTGDSPVDAVIITNEEMAPAFQVLADWHMERGSRCVVRTVEWILQNYPVGADIAETIRFFLQDAYQLWGLQSVLVGGDTTEIPVRYFSYQRWENGLKVIEPVPNDLYFSCLDGNWNEDGDQNWAEAPFSGSPGDNADLVPELLVGRIPVSNLVDAQGVVDKIIAYRESPPAVFQDKMLFLAEVLFPANWPQDPDSVVFTDGARYATDIIDDFMSEEMEATCLFQNYVNPLWAPYNPQPETVASSLAAMETGDFAFVDHNGHGYRYNMSVGDGNVLASHARNLTNENPFHITLMNCTSTAFDFDCLGEAYLRNPGGGAASVFGTTRESFPAFTGSYYDRFYEILFAGESRTGLIFDQIRQEHYMSALNEGLNRWTYFIVAYLGDPLLDLWAGDAIEYSVTAPASVNPGPVQVDIQVAAVGGGPVEDVHVTLLKSDEVWVTGLSDAVGEVSFQIQPASEGDIQVVVWGRNGVMYRSTIGVSASTGTYAAITGWSLDDDDLLDPLNDDDGLGEAGERLRLSLEVSNLGDTGLVGTQLDITSLDPSLPVSVSHEDLGAIAAGGSRNSTDLEILPALDLVDGQRLPLLVTLSAPGQDARVDTLHLQFAAPDPILSDWILSDALPHGNGNGELEAGESFRAIPRLVNLGRGDLSGVDVALHKIGAGVTLADSLDSVPDLELLESGAPDPGFLLTLDDPAVDNLAWYEIIDHMGRSWIDTLDFLPPAAPSQPVAQVSDLATRVIMVWEPGTEDDLQGYHVYFSLDERVGFERYTQRPIEHARADLDGLPESSAVACYVTAVDEGGMESAPSEILYTSTNPAQNAGFPQELQANCTSSLAVGNINGTGGLEIVTGANNDFIYAFNWTGQEILDGDGSAQTPGIYTTEALDIVGAVTLLPVLDNGFSQIVVASRGKNASGSTTGLVGIHIFDQNGEELEGWPQQTINWIWSNVAGADLDGDGNPEIVAVDISGYLYAFHHDGTEVRDGDNNPSTHGVFKSGMGSWNQCSPALCDLDGEPGAEILITDSDGVLHVFKSDGSEIDGFPLLPEGGGCLTKTPILVADLDGDESPEIVVLGEWDRLFVFTAAGENFGPFPINFTSEHPYDPGPGPAPCNIDGDSDLELFVVENLNYSLYCELHLMDHNGNDLPGWPIGLHTSAYASPLVGDVDGDGQLEFVVGCENGLIYGFNEDGSVQAGFPINVGGEVRGTPALVDLDQDGDVELVSSTFNKLLYVWDFAGAWSEASFPWPTNAGNYRRTGCYGDWDNVPVLLEGLSVMPADRSVHLEWSSDSPELRSWSLERQRWSDESQWDDAVFAFVDMSFANGDVVWDDKNLEPGARYRYTAVANLLAGGEERFPLGSVDLPPAAWTDKLHGGYPNPFNPSTTLRFEMASAGAARLEVFAIDGRRLRTLVDEQLEAGLHERIWDGRDNSGRPMASGVYFAQFKRPGLSESKRLVLLK